MLIIEQAILRTVAYADVFDYPLSADEIHWYLWGLSATRQHISHALRSSGTLARLLSYVEIDDADDVRGYYTLAGREWIADTRLARESSAVTLWDRAWRYGQIIAQMPFVRMVALTGSLAVGNVEPGADIDYFVITTPGRLWTCRAAVIALAVWAARRGDVICPNFFLSENALALRDRNFYTAHEFAQMIPLYGMDIYRQMQLNNGWVQHFLPNALDVPRMADRVRARQTGPRRTQKSRGLFKRITEASLGTTPGSWVEGWEMRRKLRKFDQKQYGHPESNFGPDCCKGHFNDHMTRTLDTLSQRLREIELRTFESQRVEAVSL